MQVGEQRGGNLTQKGSIPWGLFLLAALLAWCVYCGFARHGERPDDWVDGRWQGSLVGLSARDGMPLQAPVQITIDTSDAFMQNHHGKGTIDIRGHRYGFELHAMEVATDNFQPGHPPVAVGPGAYKITGNIVIDGMPENTEELPDFTQGTGSIQKTELHLQTDAGSGEAKRVALDLKAAPTAHAGLSGALDRAWLAVLFLPLALGLYVFRYRPWASNVWVIGLLTIFAGASFGITWVIALVLALAGERAVLKPRSAR